MHYIHWRLSAIAICVAGLCFAQLQPSSASSAANFFRKYLEFSETDIASLEKGQLVARLPKTSEQREVAVFAAIRVKASPRELASQFRDVVGWKKGDSVPEIGKFSEVPAMADLS